MAHVSHRLLDRIIIKNFTLRKRDQNGESSFCVDPGQSQYWWGGGIDDQQKAIAY